MSTLSFKTEQVSVQLDLANQLSGIARTHLPVAGYTNIKYEGYVFAEKNGCLVDLLALPISGTLYWQAVLCVGPTQAAADAVRDEVSQIGRTWLQETAI